MVTASWAAWIAAWSSSADAIAADEREKGRAVGHGEQKRRAGPPNRAQRRAGAAARNVVSQESLHGAGRTRVRSVWFGLRQILSLCPATAMMMQRQLSSRSGGARGQGPRQCRALAPRPASPVLAPRRSSVRAAALPMSKVECWAQQCMGAVHVTIWSNLTTPQPGCWQVLEMLMNREDLSHDQAKETLQVVVQPACMHARDKQHACTRQTAPCARRRCTTCDDAWHTSKMQALPLPLLA